MSDDLISIGPLVAVYPRLNTPDTKFDELGMYKADGKMSLADAEDTMKELSERYKRFTKKPLNQTENTLWYMETDEEGKQTGQVVFKIRVKNKLRKRDGKVWDRKPALFDASLKPFDANVYGGSTYIVSAEFYEWDTGSKKGCSLQPVGVQVLSLVTGDGTRSASSFGFKARDGFVAEDKDDDDQFDDDDAASDDAEDGDY